MAESSLKPWKSKRFGKAVKGLDARYNKVVNIENNGDYATIQFVRKSGEIVVGEFKLIGWGWAPFEEQAKTEKMFRSPPLTIARGSRT